jgi:hypothetical protein
VERKVAAGWMSFDNGEGYWLAAGRVSEIVWLLTPATSDSD